MRNLLDGDCRRETLERFAALTPETAGLFGRLTVGQMVCHVADPLRIALGAMDVADASNLFTRTALRWMVLAGMPTPKGKIQTFPELDHARGGGTPPTDLPTDIATLREMVARFVGRATAGEPFVPSPAFGAMSARAYGRLMALHMDHHLRQFGV